MESIESLPVHHSKGLAIMHPIILALLLQPLLGVSIILICRRIQATTHLTPALVISGITGAILVAIFTYTSSTIPIAPYELDDNAWYPIYGQVLLSLYIGFGLGTILATLIGVPYTLLKDRSK
jgi:hypothetical protein